MTKPKVKRMAVALFNAKLRLAERTTIRLR